ncbi:Imm21 family immunity protein [Vandammella animalimorsus]|uniref:Imm21 family immunity protein n=1 Tax=Vandammella animalimorsus TaxID=2029117 RepID=UPI0031BB1157
MAKKFRLIKKQYGWIFSAGGPLILVSGRGCSSWSGNREGSLDYLSACEVADFVGIMEKNGEKVVVFADEPLSAYVLICDDGVFFLRWRWGEDDFDIVDHVRCMNFFDMEAWEDVEVGLKPGGYFLFDAALPGNTLEKYEVPIEKKVAFAKTYLYQPDDENSFLINAFFY